MSEQALTEMEADIAHAVKTISNEIPFPQTIPQPVDSEFDDNLRDREEHHSAAIDDLNKTIQDMERRRDEHKRALKAARAAREILSGPQTVDQ